MTQPFGEDLGAGTGGRAALHTPHAHNPATSLFAPRPPITPRPLRVVRLTTWNLMQVVQEIVYNGDGEVLIAKDRANIKVGVFTFTIGDWIVAQEVDEGARTYYRRPSQVEQELYSLGGEGV